MNSADRITTYREVDGMLQGPRNKKIRLFLRNTDSGIRSISEGGEVPSHPLARNSSVEYNPCRFYSIDMFGEVGKSRKGSE